MAPGSWRVDSTIGQLTASTDPVISTIEPVSAALASAASSVVPLLQYGSIGVRELSAYAVN